MAELINSTEIITREQNFSRLIIAEAIAIHIQEPTLNVQTYSHHTLPSIRRQWSLDIQAHLQTGRT